MSEQQTQGGQIQRFGHYQLKRVLGEGGYGRVYAAWDEHLLREVAIKFVTVDRGRPDSLRHEAQRLASQRHPAFVNVFALEQGQGQLAMVMELVRGRTLAQLLREIGALPVERVLRYGMEAATALAEAHRSGWAHGDLKPSNLMLADDGQLRILDFGAAAAIDPLDTASVASGEAPAGTLAYLAPERLLGARASVRGDIYALGLVLFEALTGCRQTESGEEWGALHMRLYGNSGGLQLPAHFDARLCALIERMTRRRPQARPASMLRVQEKLLSLHAKYSQEVAVGRRQWIRWGAAVLVIGSLFSADRVHHHKSDVATTTTQITVTERVARAEQRLSDFDQAGAVAEAVALLEGVLAEKQTHATAAALLGIAYCLRYAGDERDEVWLRRAAAASALAVQTEPQLALAQAARGWSEEYQGHKEEAERHYRRALTLDPGDRYALLGLARLYTSSQRESEAEALVHLAITRYPKERSFQDALGTLLYQRAAFSEAERVFRRSIELKPDGVQAYVNLSAALQQQNRAEEALQVLQRGMRLGAHGQLYSNLGSVLFALGRYEEAVVAFEQALSTAKGSPNDYLKWANLGDALRWQPGREAQARDAYVRAQQLVEAKLQRSPDNAKLVSRSALYAARLRQFDLAIQRANDAVARAPGSADTRFRAALVAELAGQRESALAHLRRAVEQGYPSHMIDSEPDLLALRRDRRYHRIFTGSDR